MTNKPTSVRRSYRLLLWTYRALLRLYPRIVWQQHGNDMVDVFSDMLTASQKRRGRLQTARMAFRTFFDVPLGAWRAHRYQHRVVDRLTTPFWSLCMDTFAADLRFAVRSLMRRPGLTLVAVASFALGIGANTTMISAVNAALWQELPVPEPERLVRIARRSDGFGNLNYANFRDIERSVDTFTGMFAHSLTTMALNVDGRSIVLHGELVTGDYFRVLGIDPSLGRFFQAPEGDNPNAEPTVVISYALWQSEFGADPNVIGRVVRANSHPLTVIGVAPRDFHGTKFGLGLDFWVPLDMWASLDNIGDWATSRGGRWLSTVARLTPGTTAEQALHAVNVVADQLALEYPEFNRRLEFGVFPELEGEISPDAVGLPSLIGSLAIGASTIVLLVACANIASLLLSRGTERHRELGIRLALGAGRGRIIRLLLTESFVIAALGGALGVALAYWTAGAASRFLPPIPYRVVIGWTPDLRALTLAGSIAFVAAFLFGIFPALRASRTDVVTSLKTGITGVGQGGSRLRALDVIVTGMTSLSFVMLVLTALFARSLNAVRHIDPGFDTDGGVLASVGPDLADYNTEQIRAYYHQLVERLASHPEVDQVAIVGTIPLGDSRSSSRVYASDVTYDSDAPGINAWRTAVSPNYFAAMGTMVLQGRAFQPSDDQSNRDVVIINQELARRLWPNTDPIGRFVRYDPTGADGGLEVVGVVETGFYTSVTESPTPAMFRPIEQTLPGSATVVVRSSGLPSGAAQALREVSTGIAPLVPVFNVRSFAEHMAGASWLFRLGADIGASLGLLALALAFSGLYGVMAFSVRRRMRELGIRLALGAYQSHVVRLVLRRAVRLVLTGVLIGGVSASLISGLLASVLIGVTPRDPVSYLLVTASLIVVGLLASLVPARLAASADPAGTLRSEN